MSFKDHAPSGALLLADHTEHKIANFWTKPVVPNSNIFDFIVVVACTFSVIAELVFNVEVGTLASVARGFRACQTLVRLTLFDPIQGTVLITPTGQWVMKTTMQPCMTMMMPS